jgi:hypothetical protein
LRLPYRGRLLVPGAWLAEWSHKHPSGAAPACGRLPRPCVRDPAARPPWSYCRASSSWPARRRAPRSASRSRRARGRATPPGEAATRTARRRRARTPHARLEDVQRRVGVRTHSRPSSSSRVPLAVSPCVMAANPVSRFATNANASSPCGGTYVAASRDVSAWAAKSPPCHAAQVAQISSSAGMLSRP